MLKRPDAARTPRDLCNVSAPERAILQCRDGVTLVADVYRPEAPGPHPVLLMRQPYGRRIASTVVFAHPAWYAAHGYIVVIQDVRGCGDSGGSFRVFADDVADGAATLAWAADLKGANGRVGTYGFSYQGTNQLLALAARGGPEPSAPTPSRRPWRRGAFATTGPMRAARFALPEISAGLARWVPNKRGLPATRMLSRRSPQPAGVGRR